MGFVTAKTPTQVAYELLQTYNLDSRHDIDTVTWSIEGLLNAYTFEARQDKYTRD